jgi:hypothetical protein
MLAVFARAVGVFVPSLQIAASPSFNLMNGTKGEVPVPISTKFVGPVFRKYAYPADETLPIVSAAAVVVIVAAPPIAVVPVRSTESVDGFST